MKTADLLGTIPPHAIEAERAVLGCILLEGAEAWSRIGVRLETDDFYLHRHRELWATYRDLVADGLSVDLVTTFNVLRQRAEDLGVVPAVWLAELVEEAATLGALESYTAIILRDSARRLMLAQANDMLRRASNADDDPAEIA